MMTEKKNKLTDSISASAKSLVDALAAKGTPGIIFLGIIFLTIWAPMPLIVLKFFQFIGVAKDLSGVSGSALIITFIVIIILTLGYMFAACKLTLEVMRRIVPTIHGEAEVQLILSKAVGGEVTTILGKRPLAISIDTARTRTMKILLGLVDRSNEVLCLERAEDVRCNIFTLNEDGKLRITDNLHVNMRALTPDDKELTIAIPIGHLSSGRAFKYFRPVLSIKNPDGKWPHMDINDVNNKEIELEVKKAHPDLSWIISMPIPYQIGPFKLVCGILNIDGLCAIPLRHNLVKLLSDLATAAALLAVLNRTTGFLSGLYYKPVTPDETEREAFKKYMISPEEFDPAECPEPSEEFVKALSKITGLEDFSRVSPMKVATYLRDQLRA